MLINTILQTIRQLHIIKEVWEIIKGWHWFGRWLRNNWLISIRVKRKLSFYFLSVIVWSYLAGQRPKGERIFIFLTCDWSIQSKQASSLVNWDPWSITGIQPTLQTYLFLTNWVQTVYVRIENEGLMDLIPYQLPNLPRDIIIGMEVMEWKPHY